MTMERAWVHVVRLWPRELPVNYAKLRHDTMSARGTASGPDSLVGGCMHSKRATRQRASSGDQDAHALESGKQGERSDGPREVYRASLTETGHASMDGERGNAER